MDLQSLIDEAKSLLAKGEALFEAQPATLQTFEGKALSEAVTALTPKLETAVTDLADKASPTFGPDVAAFLNGAVAKEEAAIEADLADDIAAANAKAEARRTALAPVKASIPAP